MFAKIQLKLLQNNTILKFSSAKNIHSSVKIIRRWKFSSATIFVGKNFRYLTKISSLFADEVFTDKVIVTKYLI